MLARDLVVTLADLAAVAARHLARLLGRLARRVGRAPNSAWLFLLGASFGAWLTLLAFLISLAPVAPVTPAVAAATPSEGRRPGWPLLLQFPIRQEVVNALAQMSEQELTQAYVDVHLAFESSLDGAYLGAARNLIDYAFLTERELALRSLSRPPALPSPTEMLRLFEQLL